MFLKIALLNVIKHIKRSAVVFAAVAVAVLVLSLISSVVQGLGATFLQSILPTAGHLQIKDARVKEAPNPLDLKYLIPDAETTLKTLDDPRILASEAILTFPALLVEPNPPDIQSEAKSIAMAGGHGVRPDTVFLRDLRQGLVEGEFLPNGEGILLSKRVADLLDVRLGGTVMVLTQDRGNNPWYQEIPITGIFRSGSEQTDLSLFAVSTATAQSLLDAEGMAREFRMLLNNPDESPAVAAALKPRLETAGLRAESWQELFGSLLAILAFLNVISFVIRLFFIIVAGSVITNSILMTVFERTREYGTLRAIGLRRRQLRAMILTEGAVLGGLGAVAGLVLGVPFVWWLSQTGLDIGNATEYLGFASLIYPVLAWSDVVFNLIAGVLIALAASAYAASVSSKLSVTESLTHT